MKIEMITHMDSKLTSITTSLNKIEGSLSTLGDQVAELEQRVGSNEDDVQNLLQRVKTLEADNAYLKDRAEDAENRSRAYNLRFLNIPEKAEGRDILGFMNRLIPQLLGEVNFPAPPAIERCHRSPTIAKETSGARSRPILVKLLHFQDKLKILKLSRVKKELVYNGTRVYIYPDFSAALVQKRRLFDPSKRKLRDLDIKYSMIFPCTLRVVHGGKPKLFRSPDEVEAFLSELTVSSP